MASEAKPSRAMPATAPDGRATCGGSQCRRKRLMTRFALTLEFDGGPFMGLQRQDHGPSVQQAVEQAVFAVTGETVTLHSAGRTDSGVHALAMVSHVDVAKALTPFRLMEALNARLRPAPIALLACEARPDDWHARFSCLGRRYLYRIRNRREIGRAHV